MNERPKKWTPMEAWERMKTWCAWQERCHYDCSQHLRQHGLSAKETDEILGRLVAENHLNEEQYAVLFAGGHFRIKKWGKKKIIHALQQKQISAYCIKKAMAEIIEPQYVQNLHKLASAKWKAAASKTPAQRWLAVKNHLLQKGYEPADVFETLQALRANTLGADA